MLIKNKYMGELRRVDEKKPISELAPYGND